jgi:hypothetical protein
VKTEKFLVDVVSSSLTRHLFNWDYSWTLHHRSLPCSQIPSIGWNLDLSLHWQLAWRLKNETIDICSQIFNWYILLIWTQTKAYLDFTLTNFYWRHTLHALPQPIPCLISLLSAYLCDFICLLSVTLAKWCYSVKLKCPSKTWSLNKRWGGLKNSCV